MTERIVIGALIVGQLGLFWIVNELLQCVRMLLRDRIEALSADGSAPPETP